MASLRGGDALYADSKNAAVVAKDFTAAPLNVSQAAYVGTGPYVVVFFNNSGNQNATFKIQATGSIVPSAGLNNLPTTWYDYEKTPGTVVSLTVNSNATACIDLSPFGPELIRLVRTDSNGDTTMLAFITANGPN